MSANDNNDGKVIDLSVVRGSRQPQLTDGELIAIRQMLEEWRLVSTECPLARKIINGDS